MRLTPLARSRVGVDAEHAPFSKSRAIGERGPPGVRGGDVRLSTNG
jgi:hypothetical protein